MILIDVGLDNVQYVPSSLLSDDNAIISVTVYELTEKEKSKVLSALRFLKKNTRHKTQSNIYFICICVNDSKRYFLRTTSKDKGKSIFYELNPFDVTDNTDVGLLIKELDTYLDAQIFLLFSTRLFRFLCHRTVFVPLLFILLGLVTYAVMLQQYNFLLVLLSVAFILTVLLDTLFHWQETRSVSLYAEFRKLTRRKRGVKDDLRNK